MHVSSWQERAGVRAKTLPQPEALRGGPHRRSGYSLAPGRELGQARGPWGRLMVRAGRTGLHPGAGVPWAPVLHRATPHCPEAHNTRPHPERH
ncbi:hypothetical protein VULLAG_LOCUS8712 [Vulpes lagopus]